MAFVPFQHRPPQKFLRHERRRFCYPHGSGTVVIAYYLDKKGKPQEVEAQVIWDKLPFSDIKGYSRYNEPEAFKQWLLENKLEEN